MQRGFKFLIISGILFISSITIFFAWGMSFSEMFILDNSGLTTNQITLEPQNFYNSSIFVNSTNKLLTITIDAINTDQVKLNEFVIGPNNEVISNATFQKTYFSTITPKSTGEYKLSIYNLDDSITADMYIFFGNLPFLTESGEIDFTSFAGLIAGVILFIGGLGCLMMGILFFIKDRNKDRYRDFIPR